MARPHDSKVTQLADFFREGDEAQVRVTFDLVRDIMHKRFPAKPKVAPRKRRTAAAPAAQSTGEAA